MSWTNRQFDNHPRPKAWPLKRTILIVEDDASNMKVLNDVLTVHGYRVLVTVDGVEALILAGEQLPDLILMDIRLPGMSGVEATKWLKLDGPTHTIPVIAVTAYAMAGDEAAIRRSGCDDYISKPVSIPRLLSTIRKHLPRPSNVGRRSPEAASQV